MEHFDYILVGGGPASRILNKYLHIFNKSVKVAVFRDEDRIVNHCGTPYIVEGVIPWEKGLIKEELVTKFNTPIIKDPVVDGNPNEKTITTASGKKYSYDKLVFATGTDQIIPNIKGNNLKNILKVRKTDDVIETIKNLEKLNNIIVIGGGYIGLEFAVSLKNLGKHVTLIELQPHVMGNRMDEKFSKAVEQHLTNLGINLLTGKKVTEFLGDETVNAVLLESDEIIKTDAVLSAIGVKPLVDYAENFGITTTKGGILVDEYFNTNINDIYAIGDCVETISYVTKKPAPGKLGSNAGQMARTLALNFQGIKLPYKGVINAAVTSMHGLSVGSAGISENEALSHGIEVLTGFGQSFSTYNNMPGYKDVSIKVIYDKETLNLIGVEIVGEFNPAGFLETAAAYILNKTNLYDIITSHYSSHPELTPKTSHPFFVLASEEVLKKTL